MVRFSTPLWRVLERWTARLYLIAGVVLTVYAAINGLAVFMEAPVTPRVLQAGYIAGFLGLLGIYPRVAHRRPWLARAGAATAVIGVVVFTISTLNNLADLAGLTVGGLPGMSIVTAMGILAFVAGYPLVSVAVLSSGTYTRTVGLLLLAPAVIIVFMLATIVTNLVSPATVFVVSAGQAMTHLAIGSTLKIQTDSTDRNEAESPTDATEEDTTAA